MKRQKVRRSTLLPKRLITKTLCFVVYTRFVGEVWAAWLMLGLIIRVVNDMHLQKILISFNYYQVDVEMDRSHRPSIIYLCDECFIHTCKTKDI